MERAAFAPSSATPPPRSRPHLQRSRRDWRANDRSGHQEAITGMVRPVRCYGMLPLQSPRPRQHADKSFPAHGIVGFRAHDVRLVAAMQTYGIAQLLTFNAADFRGFAVVILDSQPEGPSPGSL